MQHDDAIRDEAVTWAVRTGDPGFAEWDAFEAWLTRSPEHARAYDHVASTVAEAADGLRDVRLGAANDDVPRRSLVTRRWFGGAIAASMVAILALFAWPSGGTYYEETAPGETRMIALADGGRIDLAGGSRIELDREDSRFARLEGGRALFTIRHDEARPFRVLAGSDTLLDVGTVFDVSLDETTLSVAVAEGAVVFNPKKQSVRLSPGDRLSSARGSDGFERSRVAPGQVGEWREGRLTFDDATLADAARQLRSLTGVRFRAAEGDGARISGSILLAPVRADPRAAGALLGIPVTQRGEEWVLGAN